MKFAALLALSVCASVSGAQALVPVSPGMSQAGGFDYFLGSTLVSTGSTTAPSAQPLPGSFGPFSNSHTIGGANWSTTTSTAWSISSTATTTSVSAQVTIVALADATASSQSATNTSWAQISFVFAAAQPVSFTANWSSPVGGPFFGTPSYLVLGTFSPYAPVPMPSLAPVSNSGTLPAGTHTITMVTNLTVTAQAGLFVNDVVGLGFDLHATVIPAPGVLSMLALAMIGAAPRRR